MMVDGDVFCLMLGFVVLFDCSVCLFFQRRNQVKAFTKNRGIEILV